MEPLTLGERISLLRRRQGLSQQQLADQLVPPVSQTQIHRLEKGLIQDPHLSMVKALAHQLHVTIDWLAGAPAPAEETAQTRHRPRKAQPVG